MVFADTAGVSKAAQQLGVSQPVVSKKLQIFYVAEACGSVLLRSANGHVALTDSAHSVLPAIRELIDRYDRILGYLHGEGTAPRILRIGTGAFAAEHYLPTVLATLRSKVEECQMETRVCRGRDRIVGTAKGQFDISIVTHDENQVRQTLREERLNEDALTITSLGRHAMCVLASRQTAAGRELLQIASTAVIPISKLAQWELIGPDNQSGIRRQLESRFERGELYFVAEGGGWAAAKEYARVGLGVAIVPWVTVSETDRKTMVARRLANQFAVADFVLQRRDESNPFIEQVKQALIASASRVSKLT